MVSPSIRKGCVNEHCSGQSPSLVPLESLCSNFNGATLLPVATPITKPLWPQWILVFVVMDRKEMLFIYCYLAPSVGCQWWEYTQLILLPATKRSSTDLNQHYEATWSVVVKGHLFNYFLYIIKIYACRWWNIFFQSWVRNLAQLYFKWRISFSLALFNEAVYIFIHPL